MLLSRQKFIPPVIETFASVTPNDGCGNIFRMGTPLKTLLLCLILSFLPQIALAEPIVNAVPFVAKPIPLSAVRLTGGPLKHAQELDAGYLLKLEPDRMLYALRQHAGLDPKADAGYGGWDSTRGKQLTGHIAGHYLSAVSDMFAATGDDRFKQRVDYIVAQLKEVQDKQGDGYIGGLTDQAGTDGKTLFQQLADGTIRGSAFDLNGMWSPWYVEHKIFAGLRDAYRQAGNRDALEVEIKFAGWAEKTLSKLNDQQLQRMLNTEFGGMNEVLADLYADTGDKRWLTLSDKFYHHAVIDPLAAGNDILGGKHGNTQVPKLLGHLARYIYTGNETDGAAARFFWNQVAMHHSFATGGHGYDEYFGPADELMHEIDGSGQRSGDLRTCESCNVYNMLKMERLLFALKPDESYAAFEERALFNHVLGSIDPEDGRVCYMVPVGPGVTHEYQNMMQSFTCCVGSGMESHALHGDGIYYESGDKLWINLYVPTTAEWKSAGAKIEMQTDFPEGSSATFKVLPSQSTQLTLAFRRPQWAGDGFAISVNGQPVNNISAPGSYVEIARNWSSSDTITLTLPKQLHTEPLPDDPNRVALMWGPLVLGGDLGPEQRGGRGRGAGTRPASRPAAVVPTITTNGQAIASWLKSDDKTPGNYHATVAGRESDVEFVPFYRLHRKTYSLYWDLTGIN